MQPSGQHEKIIRKLLEDFPGGPVVKTPGFHCSGHGFNPWSEKFLMPWGEAKILNKQAVRLALPTLLLSHVVILNHFFGRGHHNFFQSWKPPKAPPQTPTAEVCPAGIPRALLPSSQSPDCAWPAEFAKPSSGLGPGILMILYVIVIMPR